MAPPTLFAMAQRACIRNIEGLQDIGDMDYKLVAPILRKIHNPQQLKTIEEASPHIADHTAELWKGFIARDVPNWEEKIVEPKNPRSWWKVYRKLMREEQRAKEEQEEQLKAALMGLDKKKEEGKAVLLNKVIPQELKYRPFADGIRNPYSTSSGHIKKPSKPALSNAKTGKDMLSAIRRQSAAITKERGLGKQVQPLKRLVQPPKTQIKKAPPSMLLNHKPLVYTHRPEPSNQQNAPPPVAFVTRHQPTPQERAIKRAMEAEKEDRLRALTGGGSKATPAETSIAPSPRPATSAPRSQPTVTLSPPRPMSSGIPHPRANVVATASPNRGLSPSPAPPVKKRPPPPASIFMPSKKRKV